MGRKTDKVYKLGVMGGTFDPVHYGHLVAAETARDELSLDKVIFIPAGKPPHKPDRRITAFRDRYRMMELATAANDFFETSSIEFDRAGPSYTIDTIRAMLVLYPGAEIYFITGADAVLDLDTWKDAGQLLALCYFVAASRPGYQLNGLREKIAAYIDPPEQRILHIEIPALAISATDIRRRVREGKTIKYLLPEPVEEYIYRHALYRD